jgi:hypothetical protein
VQVIAPLSLNFNRLRGSCREKAKGEKNKKKPFRFKLSSFLTTVAIVTFAILFNNLVIMRTFDENLAS